MYVRVLLVAGAGVFFLFALVLAPPRMWERGRKEGEEEEGSLTAETKAHAEGVCVCARRRRGPRRSMDFKMGAVLGVVLLLRGAVLLWHL